MELHLRDGSVAAADLAQAIEVAVATAEARFRSPAAPRSDPALPVRCSACGREVRFSDTYLDTRGTVCSSCWTG